MPTELREEEEEEEAVPVVQGVLVPKLPVYKYNALVYYLISKFWLFLYGT